MLGPSPLVPVPAGLGVNSSSGSLGRAHGGTRGSAPLLLSVGIRIISPGIAQLSNETFQSCRGCEDGFSAAPASRGCAASAPRDEGKISVCAPVGSHKFGFGLGTEPRSQGTERLHHTPV